VPLIVNPVVLSVEAAPAGMTGISMAVATASVNSALPEAPKYFFIFLRILSPYPCFQNFSQSVFFAMINILPSSV
jgi:hypothetical protein